MKNKEGITLIALVVTIIVLLILAGITISLVVGQNGIITRANEANIKQENATVLETMKLKVADIGIDIWGNGTVTDEESELKTQGYLNSTNIVNVEKTVGKKLNTGNGIDNDIYKVENGILNYYDKNGNKTELGEIYVPSIYQESDPNLFEFEPETGTIWLKDAEEYYYARMNFPDEVMVIPSQVDGVEVKIIGKEAYREAPMGVNAVNVKKIIIPDTVVKIGPGAFSGCISLTSIQIPEGITEIGDYAFFLCESLKNLQIPESVTKIGSSAFNGCSSLTSVQIPETVTAIGEGAFYSCSTLESIQLPSALAKIGGALFSNCSSLTKITIPNTVTSIEWEAFSYCESLTTITIPKNVTTIGERAFWGCQSLKNITIETGSSIVVPENKWGAPSDCTITKL